VVEPIDFDDVIQELENKMPPDFDNIVGELEIKDPISNVFTPGTSVNGLANYQCPLRTAIKENER
jgi:hypothetical protein